MVERSAVNRLVAGSSPARGARKPTPRSELGVQGPSEVSGGPFLAELSLAAVLEVCLNALPASLHAPSSRGSGSCPPSARTPLALPGDCRLFANAYREHFRFPSVRRDDLHHEPPGRLDAVAPQKLLVGVKRLYAGVQVAARIGRRV